MTPSPKYRKLPGVRWNPFRKTTLWLAGDHILLVDSLRFTESYRRYYLKDIQAIIVRQTSQASAGGKALNIAVIVALLAIVVLRTEDLRLSIPAILLLAGFLIVRFRGPKCVCHVITAVSRDRLPSLNRLRTAEKAVRIIQPLIEEAQRETAPAEQVT